MAQPATTYDPDDVLRLVDAVQDVREHINWCDPKHRQLVARLDDTLKPFQALTEDDLIEDITKHMYQTHESVYARPWREAKDDVKAYYRSCAVAAYAVLKDRGVIPQ
jgi:hypothetical protein